MQTILMNTLHLLEGGRGGGGGGVPVPTQGVMFVTEINENTTKNGHRVTHCLGRTLLGNS